MPVTGGLLDPADEKRIKKNFSYLLENIDAQYIIDHFVDKEIFEIEEVTEIRNLATTTEKNRLFLQKLLKSGPDAFQVFIDVLTENGYTSQADKVKNTAVELTQTRPPALYDGNLSDEEKNYVLEEKDLLSFARSFGINKKLVAVQLGLSPVELDHILMSDPHGGSVGHNLSLLIKWKYKRSGKATLGNLLEAFQTVFESDANIFDKNCICSGVQNVRDKL